jgi:hypothetical protein
LPFRPSDLTLKKKKKKRDRLLSVAAVAAVSSANNLVNWTIAVKLTNMSMTKWSSLTSLNLSNLYFRGSFYQKRMNFFD